jgi:hypothetical protein
MCDIRDDGITLRVAEPPVRTAVRPSGGGLVELAAHPPAAPKSAEAPWLR